MWIYIGIPGRHLPGSPATVGQRPKPLPIGMGMLPGTQAVNPPPPGDLRKVVAHQGKHFIVWIQTDNLPGDPGKVGLRLEPLLIEASMSPWRSM